MGFTNTATAAATVTPANTDDEGYFEFTGTSQTLDLDNDATATWAGGTVISGLNNGTNALTINPDTSVNINGSTDNILVAVGQMFTLVNPNGDDDWYISIYAPRIPFRLTIAVGDETTAITTGTAKVTWRQVGDVEITEVRSSLTTASSSGLPTVDINDDTVTMLSTKLTIDANERTSETATTAAVISNSTIADDSEMTIDIDTAGTGAAGLKVTLIGYYTST